MRSREMSGQEKRLWREEKYCLNESAVAPWSQKSRLTKCGDTKTRGSDGNLSPMGMLNLVVLEVTRSSMERQLSPVEYH